uniref:Reverse transcriptase n=1 Tax=Salvator merianae TaxID=96440 RepID=A0A8D0C0W0_SALMN
RRSEQCSAHHRSLHLLCSLEATGCRLKATKAVLKGKIISKQSHHKKMIGIEREKLELDLKIAEKQHKQIRTPRTSALLEINPDKSEAIFCNVPSWIRGEALRKLGIQEQSKKIKYLGISITRNIDKFLHRNYMDLYHQIKRDLEYWKEKNFSLLGKIMVIKMKVLPRILFLYQQIPLSPPKDLLSKIEQAIQIFVFNSKKMRIQKKITQKPSAQGGWGMPNLVFYFQATVIASALHTNRTPQPRWRKYEIFQPGQLTECASARTLLPPPCSLACKREEDFSLPCFSCITLSSYTLSCLHPC